MEATSRENIKTNPRTEGSEVIYVCKTDIEGNIHEIQCTDATIETVYELIKNNKDHWIILESDFDKRLAAFYLKEKAKFSIRYDLDDIVRSLDQIESDIYNFRSDVQLEIDRVKAMRPLLEEWSKLK